MARFKVEWLCQPLPVLLNKDSSETEEAHVYLDVLSERKRGPFSFQRILLQSPPNRIIVFKLYRAQEFP